MTAIELVQVSHMCECGQDKEYLPIFTHIPLHCSRSVEARSQLDDAIGDTDSDYRSIV